MGRRITILGMGPSAYRKADVIHTFLENTETWSLNNAYAVFPNIERAADLRWFEIHRWGYLQNWSAGKNPAGQEIDHYASMHNLGCEVVSAGPLPVVERQTVYPFADVYRHFDQGRGTLELKGSPSWMLALALYEHDQGNPIEFIQSWGIDTSDPQHQCQRQSWAQWTLRAEDRGIKIGGTMLEFRKDPEHDDGLAGLLEYIKLKTAQEKKI